MSELDKTGFSSEVLNTTKVNKIMTSEFYLFFCFFNYNVQYYLIILLNIRNGLCYDLFRYLDLNSVLSDFSFVHEATDSNSDSIPIHHTFFFSCIWG